MPLKLIIKPEAETELMEALGWYDAQQIGLGSRLYQEFVIVFEEIKAHPEHFQKKYRSIRIRYTSKFSFGVHYSLENNIIYIHAILHTSRKPKI